MPSCLASLDLFLSWNHPIVSSYIKADMGQKKAAGGGNLLQVRTGEIWAAFQAVDDVLQRQNA